jgi:putative Holliday junction resolvase
MENGKSINVDLHFPFSIFHLPFVISHSVLDLLSSIFDSRPFDTLRDRFLYFSSMRVLAIDLGSKNIGIAISDALGLTVRPLETIRRSSDEKDITRLKLLVDDLEAEAIVVGLPLRMDGKIGDAAAAAIRFAEKLRARVDVTVATQDERLTSYEADQIMSERGFSRSKRRARSDEFAAMIILRDYLAATKSEEPAST